MATISIIGAGNMATAIGTRAAAHGVSVELISRDPAKARALAETIGHGATAAEFGTRPTGDVVVLAVQHPYLVDAVTSYGEALAGTVLVDISNPFNADASGLVTAPGSSAAHEVAAAAPAGTPVVKALNTVFGHVLAHDEPLDAFYAGDDAEAKARVAAFLTSLGVRPLDAGGLGMATALEWAGILVVAVANNGAGFELSLGADVR